VINKGEIEEIVAKIARIPAKSVSSDDRNALKTLDRDLKNVVFGQNLAIDALVARSAWRASGLGNPRKPIGNSAPVRPAWARPEVARQLAFCLGVELLRFDMSEYMERHAAGRLIGAPPGYIGFDQGGQLTEAITKHPYSVLLMDEIEKAHPDIFNIPAGDGSRHADRQQRPQGGLRNVIIIMTTNAGADVLSKSSIGFTSNKQAGDEMESIKRMFTPEFRNRLDATISFASLDHEVILRVVDKFLLELRISDTKVEPSLRHGCASSWRKRIRPADGRAPDAAAAHPGHDPQGAGRRAAVRPAGQRRQGNDRRRRRRQDHARVRRIQGGCTGRLKPKRAGANNGSPRAPVSFAGRNARLNSTPKSATMQR
jgi:ATP-dependent Clp protease ATP-binding subunit ClpA